MPNVAIRVENLTKDFVISNAAIGSLKTMLLWWTRRSVQRLHVLRDLNFTVEKGECVAVIGRNGAGKSTLLSLMARIYKPTRGRVQMVGRTAPLLELGAGFHPDLTGVENVVFNAVVLGLTRKQALERLPSIVEFSELGEQVHAPVRTFSSGMLARLGFAIAIHVDADILLVDEVLSVGDFEFQKKCMDRIHAFREAHGTILLVSHQLETIEQIADRVIWIQDGVIQRIGPPSEVLADYRMHSRSDLGQR